MTRAHDAAYNAWNGGSSGDVPVSEHADRSLDEDVRHLLESGDASGAVRQVMLHYGPSIHHFCCVALGDSALADDVQQQIFMEVFRDLPRFRHRSSVRSWIFAIAHHRVLDAAKMRRRAQARISPSEITDDLANEPDPGPSPAESVDATRLLDALEASLGELREPIRIAVLLRYQQGFTFEEIAQMCGETPGTHHARVTRALRRLRAGIESRIGRQRGGRRSIVSTAPARCDNASCNGHRSTASMNQASQWGLVVDFR